MKKINFILKITPVILAVASIYLFIQNLNFKSRILQLEKIVQFKPSIERDSLIRLLEVKDIQESQYLSNQSILSDWIILYVSVLFGVVVLIQILNFEMRTKNVEQKYEEQKIANKNHFDEFYARFEDLNSEINSVMGSSLEFQAINNMQTNPFLAFELSVYAAESFLKSLRSKDDVGENYTSMQNCLDSAVYFLGKIDRSGSLNELEEKFFSGKDKVEIERRIEFLSTNLFHQEDKNKAVEILKIFYRLSDKAG